MQSLKPINIDSKITFLYEKDEQNQNYNYISTLGIKSNRIAQINHYINNS